MNSNFDFLKPEFPDIQENALEAERTINQNSLTSAFYSRRALEFTVNWMYKVDRRLNFPFQNNLSALLYEYSFQGILVPGLLDRLHYIRKLGNVAAHGKSISQEEAVQAIQNLYAFLRWMNSVYGRCNKEKAGFNTELIPGRPEEGIKQNRAELQKLRELLKQKDGELSQKVEALFRKEEELQKEQNEKARIIAENEEFIYVPEDTNEELTRKLFIDLLLKEAGWEVNEPNVIEYEVKGMPNKSGIGYVDYVLWGDDGKPLGLVEAKRTTKDASEGRQQAKLYADCLEKEFHQRPIIYYTNGFSTYMWDDLNYNPRKVQGFYSKSELHTLVQRGSNIKSLKDYKIDKNIAGRYYQEEAIKRVAEDFEKKKREALLVMATGTGKTRVSIEIVNMLVKRNWVKRVLFLADRRALVKQAKSRFTEFLPNLSMINLLTEKESEESRIVFSTYPTIMNSIDEVRGDETRRFGVGHFDLIIIDEAHRSVYFKYKAIFEYFDSLILGLTATPKAEVDRNTYELFNLDNHMPTFAYELDQAVEDRYLTPPKIMSVLLKFQREGIKYSELSEEEKADFENKFYEPETGLFPEHIESSAINSWLFNHDTIDKVLEILTNKGQKVEGGDRLGKTIIFAKNAKHAGLIRDRFEKNYPEYTGNFVAKIDYSENYAESLIDDFTDENNYNKRPIIAISVDMLDTGIDVPPILNLVFFKTVKSKAKFWQMIGRGTRLCENLFGPGIHKKYFTIFDFCENFEYFGTTPDEVEDSDFKSLSQKIFEKRIHIAFVIQNK